jgi:hypothetical protein
MPLPAARLQRNFLLYCRHTCRADKARYGTEQWCYHSQHLARCTAPCLSRRLVGAPLSTDGGGAAGVQLYAGRVNGATRLLPGTPAFQRPCRAAAGRGPPRPPPRRGSCPRSRTICPQSCRSGRTAPWTCAA